MRQLRRADKSVAEGKTGEEVGAELGVSAGTLCNWRRAVGGMDADAAKEVRELREQNARLSGCWPRLSWSKTRCGRSRRENCEPGRQAARRGHAQVDVEHVGTVGLQGGLGSHDRPTDVCLNPTRPPILTWRCRQAPVPWVPAGRPAWATLRHDEGQAINVEKVHRLWCEEAPPIDSSPNSRRCSRWPAAHRSLLRMDNGPELVSQALQQFCRRLQRRTQPPTSAFNPGLPNTGRVRSPIKPHPRPRGGLRDQRNPDNKTPGSKSGWVDYSGHARGNRHPQRVAVYNIFSYL